MEAGDSCLLLPNPRLVGRIGAVVVAVSGSLVVRESRGKSPSFLKKNCFPGFIFIFPKPGKRGGRFSPSDEPKCCVGYYSRDVIPYVFGVFGPETNTKSSKP